MWAEFKRRLLKDCAYIYKHMSRRDKQFTKLRRRLENLAYNPRKRYMCDSILNTIQEYLVEEDFDWEDAFDLAHTNLETWVLSAKRRLFDNMAPSECAASSTSPYRRANRLEVPCGDCAKLSCRMVTFVEGHRERLEQIASLLETAGNRELSTELQSILEVCKAASAPSINYCRVVGDLVVALESAGVPEFCTLNYKESQYLCKAMKQTLVLIRSDSERVFDADDSTWPPADPNA